MESRLKPRRVVLAVLLLAFIPLAPHVARGTDVFIRFKVLAPTTQRFRVNISGWRHTEPWYLPEINADVHATTWSDWIDLSKWPWHGRGDRAGGIAEWPALRFTTTPADNPTAAAAGGCALEVQLADQPTDAGVVHSFTERSESNVIGFLAPTPLREHKDEFETGTQMTRRHLAWARDAAGANPPTLKKFKLLTALWGPYDPALSRQSVDALKLLGFNVIGGADPRVLREKGLKTYNSTWNYMADPRELDKQWGQFVAATLNPALKSESSRWPYVEGSNHWVLADEVTTLDMRGLPADELNKQFRAYLRAHGATDADFPTPIDQLTYPGATMVEKTPHRDASLAERKLFYHAAKFAHWWCARQLRYSGDLIRAAIPGAKTETLPSDHGFFGAWGPPHLGMSYRMLDLFELASQQSVDELSTEDWLGLNRMYGPQFTWSGAQSFGYLCAIHRSAINDRPIQLRGLITVSDDRYLRLKANSALAQGAKSFFFWTFGPTYIGTENFWSDLRSEYDGIAKLTRSLAKSEDVLYDAKPQRDPVAILYSVSHDIWNPDRPANFVEKRLLWHALRHLQVQPDFLREEDMAQNRLSSDNFKVLYIADACISRAASAKIDQWVKDGGVVYLSAGAATRDEFNQPYRPAFASAAWVDADVVQPANDAHTYNERTDLPTIPATGKVKLSAGGELPIIGHRAALKPSAGRALATFDDGRPAGAIIDHGRGKIVALGFMPMLAYGQLANFKPSTLEETWPPAPRDLVRIPLDAADVAPVVRANHPVVEASLLSGQNGSALVLANYTYHPIDSLTIDVNLSPSPTTATSTEGKSIALEQTPTGARLHLPLDWTDIILLR